MTWSQMMWSPVVLGKWSSYPGNFACEHISANELVLIWSLLCVRRKKIMATWDSNKKHGLSCHDAVRVEHRMPHDCCPGFDQ